MVADMLRFTVIVDGEVQIDRALSRLVGKVTRLDEYFKIVADVMDEAVRKQFESEGGRTDKWEPLSPRYAEWKARRVGAKPILQLTGAMSESFKTVRISSSEIAWGSQDPKAVLHQRGTSRMVQRKIIDLTEADRTRLMKELHRFLIAGYGGYEQTA